MIFTENVTEEVMAKICEVKKFKEYDELFPDLRLRENDAVIVKLGGKSLIMLRNNDELAILPEKRYNKNHVKPLNDEQKIYMHLLMDTNIKCIIVTGVAGSGKTFGAINAAIHSILVAAEYDKLILSRPPVSPSKKFTMGFLPGSIEEKTKPWVKLFYDKIEDIKLMMGLKNKFKIEELSLEYIKGMTFMNSLVLTDEAEDLTEQEIKAILTRVGNNSKIVLMGDEEQSTTADCKNTLSKVANKFMKADLSSEEQKLFTYINLKESVRSDICSLALKVLV